MLGSQETSHQVDSDDSVKVRLGGVQNAAEGPVDYAGVIEHHVELSMLGHDGVDEVNDVVFHLDVAVDEGGVFAEVVGDGLAFVVLNVGNDDFCSVFMEYFNCTCSYPSCTAGYYCHLAF
ncbi:hypothetical protein PanWU01x14_271670 [Parasponia andersonii]|uniref:Uncharacterized protein n=1 Tax=Parasponia andersonii TaxID=3476 RepID=A0A2P5B4J9_PARAD|nr:hypothetical protein PanWU01x14_271670 [Parasponia andersonii]